MSSSFSAPKVTLHIKDGVEFLDDYLEQFDVIITDSSDPIGKQTLCDMHGYFSTLVNLVHNAVMFLFFTRSFNSFI